VKDKSKRFPFNSENKQEDGENSLDENFENKSAKLAKKGKYFVI